MRRSSSASQVSDHFVSYSQPESQSPGNHQPDLLLPRFDPLSHAAKVEKSRLRSAENAVHFIPLLLLLCAVVLWFFSHPGDLCLRAQPSARRDSHSKFVCSSMDPSLTTLGMIKLSLTEHTAGLSHCNSPPTRLARTVNGKVRCHLSLPYDRIASSTDSEPSFTARASFLANTTESSKAQQAPCPRFGVIGCQASPTSTTCPFDAGGAMPGQSQRSTRGVLLMVSSGVMSIRFSSSLGQG